MAFVDGFSNAVLIKMQYLKIDNINKKLSA